MFYPWEPFIIIIETLIQTIKINDISGNRCFNVSVLYCELNRILDILELPYLP